MSGAQKTYHLDLLVVTYKNHQSLEIFVPNLYSAEIHSSYRADLVLELLKKYGRLEVGWENGLHIHGEVDERTWKTLRSLGEMTRMEKDLWVELREVTGNLDEFEAKLSPYLVAEKLKPFGGTLWDMTSFFS